MGRFLSLPDPNGDFTILSMILPELRTEMATLLGRLNRDGASTATHTIMLRSEDGSSESLVIHASRITPGGQAESYVLIAFVPAPAPAVLAAPDVHAPLDQEESIEVLHSQLAALREELAGTREHLQAVIEELESSNEELQAMNEELQASSEELQATNEELETTNEELQATNEELTTVNETLQVRTTELSETNEILRNIQMAVNTAIVLVDRNLRVLQFSPLAVKVIGLVPEDIGTPLELLPSHVDISELAVLVRKVLATGEGQIVETSTSTAGYFMQVVPYVKNDTLVGAVIALSDITELRETRLEAERKSALLKGIFTMAGTPMAWLGEDGSIRQCNADLLNLIGRKEVELVGKTPTDLVLPGYRDHVSTALAAVGAGREPSVRMTVELVGGTQELLSVDMTLARLEGPDRSQRVLLATFHDLTAAHSAHAALEAREQQLEAVFSGTGAPMALCDTDGLISRANPALCDILGYGPAEIRGTRLDDITYPDDVDADATMFNALAAGKRATYQIDKRFLKKDGGIIWGREVVSLSHTPEPDNPPFVIATVLDITAERQREAAALAQAQSDPLTGLANRILAFDRLRQATLRTQRTLEAVFVLLIDLNGFKGINDRLGHEIGDEVLKETAHRIESAVRETDTVARIGATSSSSSRPRTPRTLGMRSSVSPNASSRASAGPWTSPAARAASWSRPASGWPTVRPTGSTSRSWSARPTSRCTHRSARAATASPSTPTGSATRPVGPPGCGPRCCRGWRSTHSCRTCSRSSVQATGVSTGSRCSPGGITPNAGLWLPTTSSTSSTSSASSPSSPASSSSRPRRPPAGSAPSLQISNCSSTWTHIN